MEGVVEYNEDGKAIGEWILSSNQAYIGCDKLSQPIYRNDVVYVFKMYRFPQVRFTNICDN